MLEQGTTYIQHLHARSAGRDTLAEELRLSRWLSSVDLRPPGLPATTILCVRRLRVVVEAGRRGALADPRSEQRIASSLDELARQAARPAQGAVPANAEAIVFDDHAEMLACLARDWCSGSLAMCWWWPGLLRSSDLFAAVVPAWFAAPQYVPAALHQLARSADAVSFAQRLEPSAARLLLARIIREFGLSALSLVATEFGSDRRSSAAYLPASDRRSSAPGPTDGQVPHAAPLSNPAIPPWQPWAQEISGVALDPIQSTLLGVGLMLVRASSAVRSPVFAEAVQAWIAQSTPVQRSATTPMPPAETRPMVEELLPPFLPGAVPPDSLQPTPASIPIHEQLPALSAEPLPSNQPSTLLDDAPEPTVLPGASSMTSEVLHAPTEAEIETEYGGLCYLINLGLFLELYGDFTMPLHPGLALPIWDFIAVLGARLLGSSLAHDPIMPLLARLGGREPEAPSGHTWTPPNRWLMAPAWLDPFPQTDGWRYSTADGRLRIVHPSGFLVADVRREETAELHPLCAAYGVEAMPDAELALPAAATPLDRWLDWLLPYVVARLQLALGLTADTTPGPILCEQRAQVRVTATHLDVYFALADLPIEVRLSGLDRDPGWVPAAGRFVAFHFT